MDEYNLDALVAPTGSPSWPIDLINGDHFMGASSSPAAMAGYPLVTVPAGNASDCRSASPSWAAPGANRPSLSSPTPSSRARCTARHRSSCAAPNCRSPYDSALIVNNAMQTGCMPRYSPLLCVGCNPTRSMSTSSSTVGEERHDAFNLPSDHCHPALVVALLIGFVAMSDRADASRGTIVPQARSL